MESLEGQTLKRTIDGRPLPTERLLAIAIQIAETLGEAHDEGVIHRDLGSAKIFVADGGRAKILDLGPAGPPADVGAEPMMSIPTSAPLDPSTHTAPAPVSIAYMSPEQARGREPDVRSNVFSLGVILFEMATGSVPFSGPTEAMVLDQIVEHDPPSPISLNPRLPTGLVRLIGRALQKDPAARFTSAHEIREQLQEIRRAPGSLDSILPAEHVSSSAAVKLPPRPEEYPEEADLEPEPESDPELGFELEPGDGLEADFELESGDGLDAEADVEPGPPRAPEPLPEKFLPLWPPADDSSQD